MKYFALLFVVMAALAAGLSKDAGATGVNCKISNRAVSGAGVWNFNNCNYGTSISVTNRAWTCNHDLSFYGTPPIRVDVYSTISWAAAGAVILTNGCTDAGYDGNTIRLIFNIHADGHLSGIGNRQDGLKTNGGVGPTNIVATGHIDCGAAGSGAHQDSAQFQSGNNVKLVNVRSGDYVGGNSTCQNAGGGPFFSSANGHYPTNYTIIGWQGVGCNKGLAGGSTYPVNSTVVDSKFKTGKTPGYDPVGGDPNCVNAEGNSFFAGSPCKQGTYVTTSNLTCLRWNKKDQAFE